MAADTSRIRTHEVGPAGRTAPREAAGVCGRPGTSLLAAAPVRGAEHPGEDVSLRRQFPLQFPRPAMLTIAVAVIALATTWLPAMDLFGVEQKRKLAAEQQQTRKQVES